MSSKQQLKSGSTRCIAIDVRANDLVHIGTDTRGHNHYHDVQRDRIVVVDEVHDEYEPEDSALVRRSLVADAGDVVEAIYEGPTDDIAAYIRFVAKYVGERDWMDIHVTVIDDELLATLGGGS